MCSPTKRRDMDVMKLMMSNYEVVLGDSASGSDFYVKFLGPSGTPYEGGIWKVHVTIPTGYPYKSPSIGFCNKVFHPNVDEASGSVCLDVINQTWSPMYDLVNVFSVFLPQLLSYPNPSDPLNGHAAALMLKDKQLFAKKVQDHIKQHASTDFTLRDDDDDEDDDGPTPTKTNTSQSSSHTSSSTSTSEHSMPSSTSAKLEENEEAAEDDDEEINLEDDLECLSDPDDQPDDDDSLSTMMRDS